MGDPCETSGCCSFLCQDLKPECDLWAQDCPEGQKCAGYFGSQSWAVKCVDVTGTDQPGDACTTEGTDSGIAPELMAYAAIYTALTDLVTTFGEEAVVKLVDGLGGRVRDGEFTLYRTRQ